MMQNDDWMFDVLYSLSEKAESAGMRRLNKLLDLCMDVYIEEEKLLDDAAMVFRSSRAIVSRNRYKVWPFRQEQVSATGHPVRPAPPEWLEAVEHGIHSTLVEYEQKRRLKNCQNEASANICSLKEGRFPAEAPGECAIYSRSG